MAPKANKRTTTAGAAAGSPKKRSKVDPIFAGIVAALQGAEDVTEQCREMLVAMAVPCLSVPKSERHNLQNIGVRQIEETMEQHKKKLVEAVAGAQKAMTDLQGSSGSLLQSLEDAKSVFEAKKVAFRSAATAREEAKAAVKEAQKGLAEAKDAQEKGDAHHAALEKEKTDIEACYQEHYKVPMDANEGPHYKSLKPFIGKLGMEDSLTSALPSSCLKNKDQRGTFDDLVLSEVGKAFTGKIESLEKSIADEVAGVSARKAAIESAEAALETKVNAEKTAMAELEAAGSAQKEAEAIVKKASEDWATFEPRVQQAADDHNMHDSRRLDFEEGALKDFLSLRDKEAPAPVEEEAAPAGA
jgi:chromosome segregation ATPase